jgi:hypothetical protein
MKMSMKIAISLLISVVLFAVFFIIASSGLFRFVEAALYVPAAERDFMRGLERTARAVSSYYKSVIDRYQVVVSQDYIPSAFLQNQSQNREDIRLREEAFYKLKQRYPDLLFVRFISEDGKYIYFSTLDSDLMASTSERK